MDEKIMTNDDNWAERLWLWADDNDIGEDYIPRNKETLQSLTELDLGGNYLTELPTEIGNLTNLTKLYLNENKLTELPAEIGNLTNLTRLHLGNNPNLTLTQKQKEWIRTLQVNGCDVSIDDYFLDRG